MLLTFFLCKWCVFIVCCLPLASFGSGAQVDVKTHDGWQPLHCATRWNQVEAMELLLRAGADVNATTNGSLTPLLLASSRVSRESKGRGEAKVTGCACICRCCLFVRRMDRPTDLPFVWEQALHKISLFIILVMATPFSYSWLSAQPDCKEATAHLLLRSDVDLTRKTPNDDTAADGEPFTHTHSPALQPPPSFASLCDISTARPSSCPLPQMSRATSPFRSSSPFAPPPPGCPSSP